MGIQKSAIGKFVIVVGPSGTGKNTMSSMLMKKNPDILFSISATTRKPRGGEVDGVNYYFMSEDEFKTRVENDEFFEWAIYADNYYGTLKKPIFDAINEDKIIIADIECQGFLQVKKILPEKNFVSIFFMPPSIDVLIDRIKSRAKIDEDNLNKRIEIIKNEMAYVDLATVKFIPVDGDIVGSFEKFEKIAEKYIFNK